VDPDLRRDCLRRLAGADPLPGERIAVVVAHADDETLGLGAQLPRMPGVTIVHVTDGAPRNLEDARRKGFANAAEYAVARRAELEAAMALVGVPAASLVSLGIPDQEASHRMAEIARRLADLVLERDLAVLITHTIEGGHPDHEATAFAANRAARLIAARDPERVPLLVEMPLYHAGPGGWVTQAFLPHPDFPELVLWLNAEERALKQRLYAAHASQQDILERFPVAAERFRVAPDHDFTALPNGGDLLYERESWGMDRQLWLRLVREADEALGHPT
jgi:LmbE family N-acetylglucosaminyl deacetylase